MDHDVERALAEKGAALVDAVERAIGPWVVRSVLDRAAAAGHGPDEALRRDAEEAAGRARAEVVPALADLLASDPDRQATTPLALLRSAVSYPTEVLRRVGVPPVERDGFDEAAFPGDLYGLSPASFADIAPELHEPGIEWGAARAFVHLARRRGEAGS